MLFLEVFYLLVNILIFLVFGILYLYYNDNFAKCQQVYYFNVMMICLIFTGLILHCGIICIFEDGKSLLNREQKIKPLIVYSVLFISITSFLFSIIGSILLGLTECHIYKIKLPNGDSFFNALVLISANIYNFILSIMGFYVLNKTYTYHNFDNHDFVLL